MGRHLGVSSQSKRASKNVCSGRLSELWQGELLFVIRSWCLVLGAWCLVLGAFDKMRGCVTDLHSRLR